MRPHPFHGRLFPDWTGQTQPRALRREGDTLQLGTASTIQSGGKTVSSVLHALVVAALALLAR